MINLTDTVKIAIIITVFSTLLLMITCILYKLSKLREVMDRQPTGTQTSGDLVSRDFKIQCTTGGNLK